MRTENRVIEIRLIEPNPYSVNLEDEATFTRLQRELKERGLLEKPVVREKGEGSGKYVSMAGWHRTKAWEELGNTTIECVVQLDPPKSPEDEFNQVNNANAIRGSLSRARLMQRVRQENLDPTKLDVFKFPLSGLVPKLDEDDLKQMDEDSRRRAKIRTLTLELAGEIAKSMLDEKDELVTMLVLDDAAAAVIRVQMKNKQSVRRAAGVLKPRLKELLGELAMDPEVLRPTHPTGEEDKDD